MEGGGPRQREQQEGDGGVEVSEGDSGARWAHRPGEGAPAPTEGIRAGSLVEVGSELSPAG